MYAVLQDRSPSAVVLALCANRMAFWSQLFSYFPETAFHDDHQGIFWFESGIRHDIFNRGVQTHLESAPLRGDIQGILGHFQQRRLPFLWHIGASSFVSDERPLFEGYGLTHYETEPVMATDLLRFNEAIPVAPPVVIQPVTTPELLQYWLRVWEFESPEEVIQLWLTCYSGLCFNRESPLRLYLGMVDGKPVATSEVFLGGGVALIGAVNTLSPYRHRGIGTAMTLMALHQAQRQGYRVGVLTASPMGITIYRRLGFQKYGTFSTYLWHPPSERG